MTINRPFVRNSLIMLFCGSALLVSVVLSAIVLIAQTQQTFNTLVAERVARSAAVDLSAFCRTPRRASVVTC